MDNVVGRNIRAFRNRKGLTQAEFAVAGEISQSSSSAWENGTSIPNQSNVDRLLEVFPDLSYDDIFSDELGFANKSIDRVRASRSVDVPLYGAIAAGAPLEMLPAEGEMPVPGSVYSDHPGSFLLRVSGGSMNRSLPDGCVALVDPAMPFVDGKMYAVRVGKTEATVKIVHQKKDGVELIPDSYDPKYAAKTYGRNDSEQVEILGRIVWYCAPLGFGR